jgi:hypothetical protein
MSKKSKDVGLTIDGILDRPNPFQEGIKNCSPRFFNNISIGLSLSGLSIEELNSAGSLGADTRAEIEAINPEDGIQLMLAAQMISIHKAQQQTMSRLRNASQIESCEQLTNLATKLSNTFIQQLNLLQKLKGHYQQKVTIEHVSINNSQAVVGNINTRSPEDKS